MMPRPLQIRASTWLSSVPSAIARIVFASFSYQVGNWSKPRRVIAKVEWHPEELYPRVGFIVTNMSRPAERVVAFYKKRGTCEQWIKQGKARSVLLQGRKSANIYASSGVIRNSGSMLTRGVPVRAKRFVE
jgi:hypothetical protein